ncbi:hypothetical protein PAPHI01_0580 [Pancytospora philotis]|nr:hypothetical protein PAPHI01_0580 [Pancytospora philotis]
MACSCVVGCRRALAVTCTRDAGYALYILFCDGVIATALLTQTRNGTTYLALLDSTGCCRGVSRTFASAVLGALPGLVVCFSHPKPEPIFGSSAANADKNILDARALHSFWAGIFKDRCSGCQGHCAAGTQSSVRNALRRRTCFSSTWSNFSAKRAYPYVSTAEIESFEDDPKSRLMSHFQGCRAPPARAFFEGLLVRSDFATGALFFSRCYTRRMHGADAAPAALSHTARGSKQCEALPDTDEAPDIKDTPAVASPLMQRITEPDAECSSTCDENTALLMLAELRRLDFSSSAAAKLSSAAFISAFSLSPMGCALCGTSEDQS